MNMTLERSATDGTTVPPTLLPTRLHHAAFVSADVERTRCFYEDVLGLPLIACWVERENLEGQTREFSHTFYGLADGGALAFFNFADPEVQARYTAKAQNMFVHLAFKTDRAVRDGIRHRLSEAGMPFREIDHGFAQSLYVNDPDGQRLEFCVDAENIVSPIRC